MKNSKYFNQSKSLVAILLAVFVLGLASCTDKFMEYNTNPDEVTDDMMDGDNFRVGAFFPQMQLLVIPVKANPFQVSQNLKGDVYSGYLCAIGAFNGGKNGTTGDFDSGNVDWLNMPFQKVYSELMSADRTMKNNLGTDDINEPVVAFSTIIKIAGVHRIAETFGPLPYSKMAEGGSLEIAYDSEEMLWNSFFTELTAAINTLTEYAQKNPNTYPMAEYDLVYGGDYVKWVKFANSLKLRLAMRCSFVDPTLAKAMAEEAVNHVYGVIVSNDDNANLATANGITVNNPLRTMWDTYSDSRMGAVMESYLTGYNDPRLSQYFSESTVGSTTGYLGGRTGVAITSKTANWIALSSPKGEFTDPVVWMCAAEVAFLKAEAALNGWNVGTTAQAAYEEGVKLSFAEKGASGADTYLADATSTPVNFTYKFSGNAAATTKATVTIKWDDAATAEKKLERIITQKWIAIFPNGAEAWAEYRRTGYPYQFPWVNNYSSDVSSSLGPRRVPFPNSEYLLNNANVTAAVGLLRTNFDGGGTRLWWDVKEHNEF
ncbi:MAG: SusD/RagB family nutrient-binding outer membrane lipoprotein [Mangrovibacterium sp.]